MKTETETEVNKLTQFDSGRRGTIADIDSLAWS